MNTLERYALRGSAFVDTLKTFAIKDKALVDALASVAFGGKAFVNALGKPLAWEASERFEEPRGCLENHA